MHSREAIDDALLTFTQMSNEQEETSCVYTNCVAFIRIRAKYFIERAERSTPFYTNLNKRIYAYPLMLGFFIF